MTVITISRQYGSGGDEIAAQVAETLGYAEFDRRMILQAAKEAGLSEQEIIDCHEDNYKIRSFLDRLFGRSRSMNTPGMWMGDTFGMPIVDDFEMTEEEAVALAQRAIESAYKAGNLVIVGRGGQVILKDKPGVLHIRIEAPTEDRIQRIKHSIKSIEGDYSADLDTRRRAQDLVEERDAASSDYTRRFYHVDWNDPTLYHMVLNTGRLGIKRSVQLIIQLAHMTEQHKPVVEEPEPAR